MIGGMNSFGVGGYYRTPIEDAAKLRLRPIIMTSSAFVVGLTPMMRASGPSALGNHSISIGAAGGMISGVLLGIFIIPVLFVVFQYLQEKVTGKPLAVLNNQNKTANNSFTYKL